MELAFVGFSGRVDLAEKHNSLMTSYIFSRVQIVGVTKLDFDKIGGTNWTIP